MNAEDMKVSAIIPAAGAGSRMEGGRKKQFLELGGEALFVYALRRIATSAYVTEMILVAPGDEMDEARAIVDTARLDKPCLTAQGGATRQDSVRAGFGHVSTSASLILVHDGVRAFAPVGLIDRVIQAAFKTGAAVAACQARDTLRRAGEDGKLGAPVQRSGLLHIQTPQCFRREILAEAIEKAEVEGIQATDESGLVSRIGFDVAYVEAPYWNIKITTKEDMTLAEGLISSIV